MAYTMVTQAGMSEALGNMDFYSNFGSLSASTKSQIEDEVRKTVEEGRKRATDVLSSRRKELDSVAKALVEYETLDLEEMKKIIKGEKLPKLTANKGVAIKIPELAIPPGMSAASADNKSDSGPPEAGGIGGVKL